MFGNKGSTFTPSQFLCFRISLSVFNKLHLGACPQKGIKSLMGCYKSYFLAALTEPSPGTPLTHPQRTLQCQLVIHGNDFIRYLRPASLPGWKSAIALPKVLGGGGGGVRENCRENLSMDMNRLNVFQEHLEHSFYTCGKWQGFS